MKAEDLSKKRKDELVEELIGVINKHSKKDWMLSAWEINIALAEITQSVSFNELLEEHKVDNEMLNNKDKKPNN